MQNPKNPQDDVTDATVTSTSAKDLEPAVVVISERRRSYSSAQKLAVVRETYQEDKSVSMVARENGISPSVLFRWRKDFEGGRLTNPASSGEPTPRDYAEAMKKIKRLQQLLGQAHEEISILQEAVEICKSKKWIAR